MILVDTNVWVLSMRPDRPEITTKVRELMLADVIIRHDFVHGELLLGVGGKTRKEVVELYAALKHAPQLPNEQVFSFARKHKLEGEGIGWVDAHLVSLAHVKGFRLWTEEKALKRVAVRLDVAYDPTRG
jgi:predicted nucleic acid-binding protein